MPYTPGQFPALYNARPGASVTTPTNTQPTPGSSPVPPPVQAMTPPAAAPAQPLPMANPQAAAPQQAPVDPVGAKPAPARKNNWFDNVMENPWLQGAMLGASFIPVVGNAVNAGFQGIDMARNLYNGDHGKAMANAAFMIPGVGAAAKLGKGALVGAKAVQGAGAAGKAVGAWKGAQTAAGAMKATQQATAAAKAAELAAKGVTRGLPARVAIGAGTQVAKMAPGVGVAMYGQTHHNNEQRQATLMDEYNRKVEDYTSQSPLHQLNYERSQQQAPLQSQAGNLQPWGSL